MQSLSTNEILKLLQTHQGNQQPTPETISSPNYPFYIVAPYWFQHQAVCLLAGIAIVDKETFTTLMHLTEIQLKTNLALQEKGALLKSESLTENEDFPTFVMKRFPIPHDKIHYLRNLNEFITESIEKKELGYVQVKLKNYPEKPLDPNRVIHALVKARKVVSVPILESLDYQNRVDRMQFPKIFPDEITVYRYWESLKIKKNSTLPRSVSNLNTPPPLSSSVSSEPLCAPVDPSMCSSLNSEEQKLPTSQLLFHISYPARNSLLNKAGVDGILKILQDRRPCPQSLFKRATWNLFEAFLAYKNIDPQIFEEAVATSSYIYLMRDIVLLLDKGEKMFQNIQSHFIGENDIYLKQITQKEFRQFLIQKKYSIPVHFSENDNNNALNSELQINPSVLTKRGLRLYELAQSARKCAIDLALNFTDQKERTKNLHLIELIGTPSIKEFTDYTETGPTPSNFAIKHQCRALAKLIKHFEPDLSINELRSHRFMQHLHGRSIDKIKPRTFSGWMNEENIRDRQKNL